MNVLIKKISKIKGRIILLDFPAAKGIVISEIPQESGLVTIAIENSDRRAKKIAEAIERYKKFIFDRSILREKTGYRSLLGKKISLTTQMIGWTFRGKKYKISSGGITIRSI